VRVVVVEYSAMVQVVVPVGVAIAPETMDVCGLLGKPGAVAE